MTAAGDGQLKVSLLRSDGISWRATSGAGPNATTLEVWIKVTFEEKKKASAKAKELELQMVTHICYHAGFDKYHNCGILSEVGL